MSNVTHSQVITLDTSHKYFSMFGKSHDIKRVSFTICESLFPKLTSNFIHTIFIARERQHLSKGLTILVKTNGAEECPNGSTVNTKYFIKPFIIQEKHNYCAVSSCLCGGNHFLSLI